MSVAWETGDVAESKRKASTVLDLLTKIKESEVTVKITVELVLSTIDKHHVW